MCSAGAEKKLANPPYHIADVFVFAGIAEILFKMQMRCVKFGFMVQSAIGCYKSMIKPLSVLKAIAFFPKMSGSVSQFALIVKNGWNVAQA